MLFSSALKITSRFVQTLIMEAYKVEAEFSQYWSRLTVVQKVSILNVVKYIVDPVQTEDEPVIIPEEHWALIMKEREAHYNGAKGYTWEEVKEMARDREKRNGLRF